MIAKASTVRALRARVATLELENSEQRVRIASERQRHAERERELLELQAAERGEWATAAAQERAELINALVAAAQRPDLSVTPPWQTVDGQAPKLFKTEDDEVREAREAAAELIEAELAARMTHGIEQPVVMPGVERRGAEAPV
jgi:hypothetical protein